MSLTEVSTKLKPWTEGRVLTLGDWQKSSEIRSLASEGKIAIAGGGFVAFFFFFVYKA